MVENTDCLNPSAALAPTGVGRDSEQDPASSIQLEEQEHLEAISAVSRRGACSILPAERVTCISPLLGKSNAAVPRGLQGHFSGTLFFVPLRWFLVTDPRSKARAVTPCPLAGPWRRCWLPRHAQGLPSAHAAETVVFSWSSSLCNSKSHQATTCASLVLCHNLTHRLSLVEGGYQGLAMHFSKSLCCCRLIRVVPT